MTFREILLVQNIVKQNEQFQNIFYFSLSGIFIIDDTQSKFHKVLLSSWTENRHFVTVTDMTRNIICVMSVTRQFSHQLFSKTLWNLLWVSPIDDCAWKTKLNMFWNCSFCFIMFWRTKFSQNVMFFALELTVYKYLVSI